MKSFFMADLLSHSKEEGTATHEEVCLRPLEKCTGAHLLFFFNLRSLSILQEGDFDSYVLCDFSNETNGLHHRSLWSPPKFDRSVVFFVSISPP